jgi:hypothetical protein
MVIGAMQILFILVAGIFAVGSPDQRSQADEQFFIAAGVVTLAAPLIFLEYRFLRKPATPESSDHDAPTGS